MSTNDFTAERLQVSKDVAELLEPCIKAEPTEGAVVCVSTGGSYRLLALNLSAEETLMMLHGAIRILQENSAIHEMPETIQ
jgi:hypothetical protein